MSLWPDIFIMSAFMISGWKYVYGIEKIMDIRLYDESSYLWGGLTLFNNISVAGTVAEKTQVYSFWYHILSLFEPDRINLYYLNYKILTVLLPIILYLTLRRYKVNIVTATVVSFFFLISNANFGVWPKVGHFASIIILTSFIAASYTKSQTLRLAMICIGALLSAYVRPEFFIIFAFSFFFFLRVFLFNLKVQSFWAFFVLGGILFLTGFLIREFGLPIDGTRSFGAFGQHFSLNWVQWTNNKNLSSWTDWEEIIYLNFGDVHSITEAFLANPRVFQKHVLSNLIHFPKPLVESFFIHANLIMPPTFKMIEAIILFGITIFFVLFSKIRSHNSFKNNMEANRNILSYSSYYLIISIISVLVIFPRNHYLLLPSILIIIMVTSLVRGDVVLRTRNYKMLLLLGIVMIFVTPSATALTGGSGHRINVETVLFIKSLEIEEEVNVLEANGGFHIYLGDNFHRVAPYDKNVDFNRFLDVRKINAIVVENGLINDSRFREDAEWENFLNHYQDMGFVKMDIPDTGRQLIMKTELIY